MCIVIGVIRLKYRVKPQDSTPKIERNQAAAK